MLYAKGDFTMTIGERIKQRRIELGLTQLDLAIRLGNKSRASVCTVEKDKEDLTTTRIQQYAAALETTPSYLMGWKDNNSVPKQAEYDIEEKEVIKAYRKADDLTKAMVKRTLGIDSKEKRDIG